MKHFTERFVKGAKAHEKFLEEFNNCLSKEIIAKTNKNKYDK